MPIRRAVVALAVAAALGASGCANAISGHVAAGSSTPSVTDAPNANIPIHGDSHDMVDQIAGNAIADIQAFWTKEMPPVFHKKYRPVRGGFYSVDPSTATSVPCTNNPDEVKDNAFYCPSKDLVVWDRTGLLGKLANAFGKYAIAMVLAHEWGHAIQARTRDPGHRTIVVETQADCYSGAFTRYAADGHAPHFHISHADLDRALSGYLLFADPRGASQNSARAHGNGFDRVSAFQQGFDNGPGYCASGGNFSDNRQFTELPFSASRNPTQDQAQNGNAPYGAAISYAVTDLAAYWKNQIPSWKPLAAVTSIDPSAKPPSCNGSPVNESIFYCTASNTIYYDGKHVFPFVYDKFGDYSVAELLATAYAFAARRDLGKTLTGSSALLGAVCYSGAYTYDVFSGRHKHKFELSPGDLDEGLEALLLGVNESSFYGLDGTTGFDRVNAFQVGFRQGFTGCQQWA